MVERRECSSNATGQFGITRRPRFCSRYQSDLTKTLVEKSFIGVGDLKDPRLFSPRLFHRGWP